MLGDAWQCRSGGSHFGKEVRVCLWSRKDWIALTALSTVECVRFALQHQSLERVLLNLHWKGWEWQKSRMNEGREFVCVTLCAHMYVCVCVCSLLLCVCPCEFASVCFPLFDKVRGARLGERRGKMSESKGFEWGGGREGASWGVGWKKRAGIWQREGGREGQEDSFWREKKSKHLEISVASLLAASQHEWRKLVRFIDWSCRKRQLGLEICTEKEKERGRGWAGEREGGREIKSEAALIC